jgi:hypothetical protein
MTRPKFVSVPINKGPIEVGRRVRLAYTVNDKGDSELRKGDEGTIVDISKLPDCLGGNRQIWVRWKRHDGPNSTMALIEGEDRFTVLD